MNTTVDIPDRLRKQARQKAARDDTTLQAIIQAALRSYLADSSRPTKKFKLEDGSVGGQGLMPGIDIGNWSQIRALVCEAGGG